MKNLFILFCLVAFIACDKNDAPSPENYMEIVSDYDSITLNVEESFDIRVRLKLYAKDTDLVPEIWEQINHFWDIEDENVISKRTYGADYSNQLSIYARNVGCTNVTLNISGIKCESKTFVVNVCPVYSTSIQMDKHAELFVGDSFILNASISPSNATNKNILFSSSDESVAIVEDGIVKTLSAGMCIITAKTEDGKAEATCQITVKNILLKSVMINELKEAGNKFMLGDELQLTYYSYPENAFNKNVKIKSSDESIVSIDGDLKLKAISKGTAIITIESEDGNVSKQYEVEVGDITLFVSLTRNGGLVIINGYVTGSIYCQFINNSNYPLKVISLIVCDGNGYILDTAANIGTVEAHSASLSFGADFTGKYYPKFIWTYEYDGNEYTIEYNTKKY